MGSLVPVKTAPRIVFVMTAWATLALAGCGSGSGNVSGEVRFNGKPLPSGAVSFLCEGGDKPVKSADIVDGKYSIPALPVGSAKITVRTSRPSGPALSMEGKPIQPTTPAAAYVPIPTKYGVPEQSGLTYDIKGGSQTHDIDLTP